MANVKELMQARNEKLQKIEQYGINPHPERYETTHEIGAARLLEDGTKDISIAGRIMSKRKMGKIAFLDLSDVTGHIQLVMKRDDFPEGEYKKFHDITDIGDFVGVKGEIFTTQAGEKSLEVYSFEFLGKSLRPLPEKYHGLVNQEAIYRERHLDLIMNEETKKKFLLRSKFVRLLREFLDNHGFIEVETPALQNTASGATAKPFITHHNALDLPMYLRIATELNLKRLIVGGYDKVYEMGRIFRNEGMDIRHNPEFTSIELYAAYEDYNDMMDITEELFTKCAMKVLGTTKITYQDQEIDLTPGWKRITMIDSIKEACGVDFNEINSDEEAVALAKERGIEIPDPTKETRGDVISLFFDEYVEKTLIQPTFIYDYPVEISPLAKRSSKDPRLTERFEIFIGGREYGNAFSELNDPIDQYERFKKQVEARNAGDEEAGMMDEDFIQALEYGMPPTGGLGIGIDRLVMLLTDAASIRDVLLFPTMKPLN